MTYATATNLLDRFDAEEIAQRADRGIPRLVTSAMLSTAAAGGNMGVYTAGEQVATAAALALVNEKLLDADSLINGYLAVRYQVPIIKVPRAVMAVACDLARYALYDDIATEQITQRYKDALKLIEAIGAGRVNIGIDPQGNKPSVSGGAQILSAEKVFGRGAR